MLEDTGVGTASSSYLLLSILLNEVKNNHLDGIMARRGMFLVKVVSLLLSFFFLPFSFSLFILSSFCFIKNLHSESKAPDEIA